MLRVQLRIVSIIEMRIVREMLRFLFADCRFGANKNVDMEGLPGLRLFVRFNEPAAAKSLDIK